MIYIVFEIQTYADGTVGILQEVCDQFSHAQSVFFHKLAAAVESTVPTHTVVLMTNSGQQLRQETFMHDVEVTDDAE